MKVISRYQTKSILLSMAVLLFSSCANDVKRNLEEKQQAPSGGLDIPLPKWNKDIEELRGEYKEIYKSEDVRFMRPYFYVSESESSYWLKVAFLNPDLENKPLREFGKEVAMSTLEHLTNPNDFEKIEIAVTQKTGFIITFSKNENAFFYLDSLEVQ